MKFDKREVVKCMWGEKNVPFAMVRYISRNGCASFRCRNCPLGLVCDHYPSSAVSAAIKVLVEAEKKLSQRPV